MYLPTVPLEFARPSGNADDRELSSRRAVWRALAARTTTRARPHGQTARLVRGLEEHTRAGEVGVDRASAAALLAVVTACTAVVRAGQDRKPRRDAGDLQPVRRLLHHQLVAPRRRRRQEDAIWLVRQPLDAPEQAD